MKLLDLQDVLVDNFAGERLTLDCVLGSNWN